MKKLSSLFLPLLAISPILISGCTGFKVQYKINNKTKLDSLRKKISEGCLKYYTYNSQRITWSYDGGYILNTSSVTYEYDLANNLYVRTINKYDESGYSGEVPEYSNHSSYQIYMTTKSNYLFEIHVLTTDGDMTILPFQDEGEGLYSKARKDLDDMPTKKDFKDKDSLDYPAVMSFMDAMLDKNDKGYITLNQNYFKDDVISNELIFSDNQLIVEYEKENMEEEGETHNIHGQRKIYHVGSTKLSLPKTMKTMIDDYLKAHII